MATLFDTQLQTAPTETKLSSHNVLCSFRQFDGQRYTRLRARDLKLIASSSKATKMQKNLADSELVRRAYISSEVAGIKFEISLHALDRLSTLYLHKFISEFDGTTGISSWCNTLIKNALSNNLSVLKLDKFSVVYEGITFVFGASDYAKGQIVLKTIE